ncbi:ligand-dependent nuclear receptor corepressor-like protein isoform X3 [Sorex araneus]|nr:ligand-dependent nuclear receptor corepressor-like protein isoform X3 [Sorex araneus]
MEKGKSALSKVLESLCIHHQQQILTMMKFLVQEQNAPSLCCYNTSFTVTSESQKPPIEDDLPDLFCNCEYRLAERGCLLNERQSLGFVPLPVCIKDLHCFSCQTVTVENIKTVVKGGIANSCDSRRCCSGLLPNTPSTKSSIHAPLLRSEVCDVSVSLKDVCRSRSPSPPPLSPVQTEGFEKLKDGTSKLSALEKNRPETNNHQPPSLTPAEISSDKCGQEGKVRSTVKSSNSDSLLLEDHNNYSSNQEDGETSIIFQDLMDRINEKLKSIETTVDLANHVKFSSSDGNTDNDLKLRDLIASLLHNAPASDYSFMELLSQHDKKGDDKIIQTRFRKRQEALFAMHSSPDSPVFRRQSLQIKRQLASFDEHFIRKKYTEKNSRKLMHTDKVFSTDNEFYYCQEPPLKYSKSVQNNHSETSFSPDYAAHSLQPSLPSLETNLAFNDFSESFKTTSEKVGIGKLQGKASSGKISLQNQRKDKKVEKIQTPLERDVPGVVSRTKRNIVPPGWYSIYVTNNCDVKKSKAKNVTEFTERKDVVRNTHIESSHNVELNKIALSSNLQVIVERLEDTVNMGKKSWNIHSLSQVYKTSKKLAEIDKDQNTSRNENLTVGRMTFKVQNLSKSVNIKSSDTPSIHFNNERFDNVKKPSILDKDSLIPSVKNIPAKYGANESSFPSYSSPVKLMFLSEVKSCEGIKYTLSSVSTSESNIDFHTEKHSPHHVIEKEEEMNEDILNANFKNCSSNLSVTLQRGHNFNSTEQTVESSEVFIDKSSDKPQEEPKENSNSATDSSFKRKPGRPKKLGPKIMNPFKRPVGRPPKPQPDQRDITIYQNESISAGQKSPKCLISKVEESIYKKSITVTVIYGRSRRTKRQVSEGNVTLSKIMSLNNNAEFLAENNSCRNIREYEIDSGERISAISSLTPDFEVLGSDFYSIGPAKNTSLLPQPSKKLTWPNQKPLAIIRKPGRPAKVKISGISVTINRTSPQEREVTINNYLSPYQQDNILEKNLLEEKYDHEQCRKMEIRHTETEIFNNLPESMVATRPLRQSKRGRKPSVHFLHSFTSSNSLIYRNNMLHKSYKLHVQKGTSQRDKHRQLSIKTVPKVSPGARNSRNRKKCLENNWLIPSSKVSLDSIISPDPLLRWWATSTSDDSLLEELNNRFEQITSAWVQVSGNEAENCFHKKREHTEKDNLKITNPLETCPLGLEATPVKMLFRKKYDLSELCTWFMQTTETQSLSLVRKANARNPLEVISTRGVKLGAKYSDFSTNPFKKHLKKFALSSPSKSSGKLHVLHKMVSSPGLNVKSNLTLARYQRTELKRLTQAKWRREGEFRHGTTDWISKRRNLRSFCQNKILNRTGEPTDADIPFQRKDKGDNSLFFPSEIRDDFLQPRVAVSDLRVHASLENKVESKAKENGTDASGKDVEREPRLGSACPNNWRSKTLKDCKIFLRKINYLEHRNTFKLNTVVYSPESPGSGSSHQPDVEALERFTLRSQAASQSPLKRPSKEIKNISASSPSTNKCTDQLENYKSSKCADSDNSPFASSETLSKLNQRKRPPWKTTEMPTKRHKRQSCNSGQRANYYSKSQLGKFFST